MVEVSEGLSEERALLDYSFHCSFHQTQAIICELLPSNLAVPNKQQHDESEVLPCLSMFSESLSFPLLSIFGLSFCHAAFKLTLSWLVLLYQKCEDEWKEGDLPCPGRG